MNTPAFLRAGAIAAWFRTALCAAAALACFSGHAHKPSDAYVTLKVDDDRIMQRLDISLRDLDRDLVLDTDDDGALTWGEVRTRWQDIQRLGDEGLQVEANGKPCVAGPGETPMLDQHTDGKYVVLQRTLRCEGPVQAFSVRYSLFATTDPTHRGVLLADWPGASTTAVLDPGAKSPRLVPGGDSAPHAGPGRLAEFIREGLHHILIGTDHMLFLLALLLPAVLVLRRAPRSAACPGAPITVQPPLAQPPLIRTAIVSGPAWSAGTISPRVIKSTGSAQTTIARANAQARYDLIGAPALKPALVEVIKVVTAFTVAHSITLAMAALGLVDPPSRWVESLIAASVLFAAVNNLHPMVRDGRWALTFAFGLVHGFGFAGVLNDLGLAEGGLAVPLFGFNLGVELGQLGIVAVVLPIAWAFRSTTWYRSVVLRGGSLFIAGLAALWLAERAFDLQLPSL